MIGREAYQNPYLLYAVDQAFYGSITEYFSSPLTVAHAYAEYIETQLKQGVKLNHMTRHLLGLFNGQPGARAFRRYISENANKDGAGSEVFLEALSKLAPVAG